MKRSLLYFCITILLLGLSAWVMPLSWVYAYPHMVAGVCAFFIAGAVYTWIARVMSWRELLALLTRPQLLVLAPNITNVLVVLLVGVISYLSLILIYDYRVDDALQRRGVLTEAYLWRMPLGDAPEEKVESDESILNYSYWDAKGKESYTSTIDTRDYPHIPLSADQHIHVIYLPDAPTVVRTLIERKDVERFMGKRIHILNLEQLVDLLGLGIEAIEQRLGQVSYGWERSLEGGVEILINRYTGEVLQRKCNHLQYQSEEAWELLADAEELEQEDERVQEAQNPCDDHSHPEYIYADRAHIYLEDRTNVAQGKVKHMHVLHIFPIEATELAGTNDQ